ncbi:MAG: NADH-quinone oxidoreductase subunit L [Ignavibacteria bacterium RIFOXYB2_FULL_35_12]|nr:MAG: NADH-quinone oxidoreductase subunit L [Ignavibacteria bacterium GWA2_36_19]OGU55752.1 MAG: NADH-quinone oxidoreductase subunit L [Ignavibacteria bacterium GWC2_35_8]OGU57072.1 MAG: NADH-quinone oxidoreductase subunit L [Ignavibacteria bacterium GWF2_35_20]OGU82712.1 MAG: NADH-quinone oxidoreductase subunit L [Ignavibacteria bacterium RIFOXYA2_FULL_35_9]OGU84737.1 MAG: NADH-quinone oxidoreductase subunit L [Ignavibacteria bacterium RIFOXYA12_FULL_35_25]OGU90671.1 MAG: NADH-quinone oxido
MDLITLSVIILFIPLLGFVLTLFTGMNFKWAFLIENVLIVLGFILSVVLLYNKLSGYLDTDIVSEFNWINLGIIPFFGEIIIKLGIKLDNVAVIMNFTVFLISMVVHLFSIDYMKGDKRYSRYFAYLGLFTFSMTGIVVTNNVLMMYIFWELVGLSSYLLIGFWFEKKSASDAGKKAFIVNRIGDLGMFAGILILFVTYKTFSFQEIFNAVAAGQLPFNSEFWLTITGLLLFCGAIGKSAQFPLHVWLPDAMEGPTPVSALIHAATMVAAGVYFIVRIFPILSGDALLIIAIIGAISAFIPATIALTQNDIKRVLAYSTVSQLGYMIMALGIGAYVFAFFHLITHAFFKACLFLGSGSVIHSMHHEQDIQKMGGLRKKMPITYATFLLATLALSGIPLTSGFLSKDGILAGTLAYTSLTGNWFFTFIGFTVAMLTAFYMFRLVILTFHGEPKNKEKYDHAHESPFFMIMPLVLLSGLSIFIWYTPNPFNADSGWVLSKWVKAPTLSVPESARYPFMVEEQKQESIVKQEEEVTFSHEYTHAMHSAHVPTIFLSGFVAGLGILFAFLFYQWKKLDPNKLAAKVKPLYNLSYNKWYFDEFYNSVFVGGTLAFSNFLRWIDNTIIDGIVNGSATLTRGVSKVSGKFDNGVVDGLVNFTAYFSGFIGLLFRKFQTGKVQTYIVLVIFSLLILLFLFKSF